MSDGSDLGSDPTYFNTGGSAPNGAGIFGPTHDTPPSPPGDHDGSDCGGLIDIGGILDLGGLIGGPGSLIDVELGQGDGHTAAVLDVVLGGDDTATVSLLGSEILGGGDILGSCGLLDGLLDGCSLLS